MPTYVVYNVRSTHTVGVYSLKRVAASVTTRKNLRAGDVVYAYCTDAQYQNNIVKMRKVKSLMTGKEIEIPSNTPHCCDPSTETYWSM